MNVIFSVVRQNKRTLYRIIGNKAPNKKITPYIKHPRSKLTKAQIAKKTIKGGTKKYDEFLFMLKIITIKFPWLCIRKQKITYLRSQLLEHSI